MAISKERNKAVLKAQISGGKSWWSGLARLLWVARQPRASD